MTYSNAKGDRAERELVNELNARGFAVMRAPASGSATERELPDVIAGDRENFYAIEVKSSSGKPIYIGGGEVDDLRYFASSFGAQPLIGARFNEKYGDPTYGMENLLGIYFFRPRHLYKTPGGNYRIKKDTAIERGTLITDL